MILLVCSFEFISVVILNQTSVTDAAAVNPDGIKTLLASLNTFFIKGKPFLSNGSTNVMVLPKNPPNCTNFTLAGKLYQKPYEAFTFVRIIPIFRITNHILDNFTFKLFHCSFLY